MPSPVLVGIDLTGSHTTESSASPPAPPSASRIDATQASLRLLDPHQPSVLTTDLGLTRGDGIFETLGVIDGSIQALEAHLSRLQHSATMLELPRLDLSVIEVGIRRAVQEHDPIKVLSVKVVITRGSEGTGKPSGWAYAFPGTDYSEQRTRGAKVVTLDRGYRSDVAQTSPWLLQGAKTLSYALNQAALREAARRGADDALFLSTDGYVLEGPNSSFLCRIDGTYTTPRTDAGILAGTTQAAAFQILEDHGASVEYRPIATTELTRAEAMWLLSSGRPVVPISHLDDRQIPMDREVTTTLLQGLRGRRT